jgi:hypothetical protein
MDDMVEIISKGAPIVEAIEAAGGRVVGDKVYVPVSHVQSYANDPTMLIIVSEVTRPGVQLFTTKLECTVFPIGTPHNKHFNFGLYNWKACTACPFALILIPRASREVAEIIAKECDLQIMDGEIFTRQNDDTLAFFPINGSAVVRLENLPTSPVHRGAVDPEEDPSDYVQRLRIMLEDERRRTDEFLTAYIAARAAEEKGDGGIKSGFGN